MTEYKAGDKVRLFGYYLNTCGANKKEKFATIVDGVVSSGKAEPSQRHVLQPRYITVKMIDPNDWADDVNPSWGLDCMELVESAKPDAPERTPEEIDMAQHELQSLIESL